METYRGVRLGQGLETDRRRALAVVLCKGRSLCRAARRVSCGADREKEARWRQGRQETAQDKTWAARCLVAAEACMRRRGQYGGFFAAATACACAACLAASTTSEKLAAGGCDFRCVACILKAPTTRRERVGVGDRTPRRRAQRGCTLLH